MHCTNERKYIVYLYQKNEYMTLSPWCHREVPIRDSSGKTLCPALKERNRIATEAVSYSGEDVSGPQKNFAFCDSSVDFEDPVIPLLLPSPGFESSMLVLRITEGWPGGSSQRPMSWKLPIPPWNQKRQVHIVIASLYQHDTRDWSKQTSFNFIALS